MDPLLILLIAAFLSPVLFLAVGILVWKRLQRRRRRESPLTSTLRRMPAHGLFEKLEELNDDIGALLAASFSLMPIFFSLYMIQLYRTGVESSPPNPFVLLTAGLLMLSLLMWRIIQLLDKRRRWRDGADAECATAQDLDPLKQHGYFIFHDLPASGFNIDHVVVGPTGVFAVETKSRRKLQVLKGKKRAAATFDGERVRFPDGHDKNAAGQIRASAKWLSKELSSAVGEPTQVRPVLSLPGWYVTSTIASDVIAMNPKAIGMLTNGAAVLNQAQIKRINYQLERLCKLEPLEDALAAPKEMS